MQCNGSVLIAITSGHVLPAGLFCKGLALRHNNVCTKCHVNSTSRRLEVVSTLTGAIYSRSCREILQCPLHILVPEPR